MPQNLNPTSEIMAERKDGRQAARRHLSELAAVVVLLPFPAGSVNRTATSTHLMVTLLAGGG